MVVGKSPDWLPSGWTMQVKDYSGRKVKCYIDLASGCKFFSKPEVYRYLETVNRSTMSPEKTGISSVSNCDIDCFTGGSSSSKLDVSQNLRTIKSEGRMPKQKKAVVERSSADGLPPGWIKEIRTRKSVSGIHRDPYYIDPLSGYIFRSKPDALRYLETGDIKRCAIKPRKMDINDMESLTDDIFSPSAVDENKLSHSTTRRQLFAGKETCVTSGGVASPEAASSKERQDNSVSTAVMVASTPTAGILEIKHSLDTVNKKCPDTKESSDPKIHELKEKRGMEFPAEIGSVSTPATDILQEDKLPVSGMLKHGNKKTQTDSRKSKNKTAPSLPGRASKRLAGLKPELPANVGLSERSLLAEARKVIQIKANAYSDLARDAAAHQAPQQLEAEPGSEIECHASVSTETTSDQDLLNKSGKPVVEQAVQEEQPGIQEAEKHSGEKPESQESQLLYPFMDSWSDPCLEFAFKTLTGAIPVEDNLSLQGLFQQQVHPSQSHGDGCSTLPDVSIPSYFQNDISSHSDAPEKPLNSQQFPANPTYPPPGNVGLPNCSSIGPQLSSLDAENKEYQTKVNEESWLAFSSRTLP